MLAVFEVELSLLPSNEPTSPPALAELTINLSPTSRPPPETELVIFNNGWVLFDAFCSGIKPTKPP